MKEKVHEDGTKAAKTPLMIYQTKLNDTILWIRPGQNERQQSVYEFWSCIIGNLRGDLLWPFIYVVLTGFLGKRESDRLPTPF